MNRFETVIPPIFVFSKSPDTAILPAGHRVIEEASREKPG
jgi:hypothetical protein